MEDYKAITTESYDLNAEEFSKKYTYLLNLKKRKEFSKFLGLLKGNKLLDIGCGSGEHDLWFKENRLEVTGIDISPAMIELCRKKGINAKLMDMEKIEFAENSFDGVWAVCSILHVPKNKVKDIISRTNLILKPKGIMFIVLKKGEGDKVVEDKINPSTKRYFVYWNKDEFEGLLNDFEIIEFWESNVEGSDLLNFLLRSKKLT